MPIAPGTRLGPYEVTAQIGVGGMGEVYRATDTNLARQVAIKVLPEAVAADADRLARFDREAKTLAALNHPNIAAIYGLERSGATTALVMELVEGPTLADRIAQGAIPVDEALPIAKQIAEALEAAHEQGIIHRDLKPANIKVRQDGTVKVLDFGLAKALEPAGTLSPSASMSPTITLPAMMTGVGMILGTAAYMSPEQAKGSRADKRSDMWAFGCVLYEMLTARRVFDGEDISETMADVIKGNVSFTPLPPDTPPAIRRLLHRCLVKERKNRLSDAAAARLDIEEASSAPNPETVTTTSRSMQWRYRWVAAIAIGVALGVAVDRFVQRASADSSVVIRPPLLRTSIDLPPDAPLALGSNVPAVGYDSPVVAVSSDGAWLAYVGATSAGRMLYVREMATGTVRALPGTDGATHPFFSPDGRWIGFLTTDQVKKIPRDGGTVIALCQAAQPVLAWWVQSAVIYFTETETFTVSKVSADGGRAEGVADTSQLGVAHFNDVLPGGESVLAETDAGIGGDYADIVRVNLRTKDKKLLIRSGYGARYVPPGYILFARGGNLMAVRYDVDKGEAVGEPTELAADAAMESVFGMLHTASSSNGVAAFVPGGDLSVGKLAWIDRRGAVEYLDVPERVYGFVDLAPDGGRLAVHVADVQDYIWIWDLARREGRRVASPRPEGFPIWNADGRRLLGAGQAESKGSIIFHDVESSGVVGEGRIVDDNGRLPNDWSPKGDVLAVGAFPGFRVEFLGLEKPVSAAGFEGFFATFSPDGGKVAYVSRQTGSEEVFIRSYPEGKLIGQVSTGGGTEPRWTPSGDLFYRVGRRWFSTHVSTGPEPRWDPPRLVFQSDFIDTPGWSYDVTSDGQRLLVVKRTQPVPTTRINLLVNWFDAVTTQ